MIFTKRGGGTIQNGYQNAKTFGFNKPYELFLKGNTLQVVA
tara:strand:+ start:825 stop:947 length:123 start_codon:yes stop_codon:yes gene_type:complete